MFEKIKKLFSGKEPAKKEFQIGIDELPGWLERQEKECTSDRADSIRDSRILFSDYRDDLQKLILSFGIDDQDTDPENPLHPKVEQVNKHSLPLFKKKVTTALSKEFSDDDEEYYKQVAEMITGCYKAYRGPGRYLHHVYPEEVKAFRKIIDEMGHELNQLTEIIRDARVRLGKIDAVTHALEEFRRVTGAVDGLSRNEMSEQQQIEELKNQVVCFEYEKKDCLSTSEYKEYEQYLDRFNLLNAHRTDKTNELESLIRTAVPVWKRAFRICQDANREKEQNLISDLIPSELQNHRDLPFAELVDEAALTIFSLLDDGSLTLKNSFEKSLFNSVNSYKEQFTGAIHQFLKADQEVKGIKEILDHHPAAVRCQDLEKKIADRTREITRLQEELKHAGILITDVQKGTDAAYDLIITKMSELTDGAVLISGYQRKSEKQEGKEISNEK